MKQITKRKHILYRPGALCLLLAFVLLLSGCSLTLSGAERGEKTHGEISAGTNPIRNGVSPDENNSFDSRSIEVRAEQVLSEMTLEEKVAQLFVLTPEQLTGYDQVTQAGSATQEAYDRFPCGGLIYMQENLQDAEQTREMLSAVQQISRDRTGLPLLTMTDEEGGSVRRISGNFEGIPEISSMAEIGASESAADAYEAGRTMGTYLSDLGFNCDCAPVADVLTNPANTVVRDRCFGSDPELVSVMAGALAEGLEEQGVIAVWKHFPGHGSTSADTHEGYAYTDRTLEELYSYDLIPFRDAIADGARMIMAAHIALPNVTGDNVPASLNRQILTDLLRNRLGYEGVIMTDALNMGAVTAQYSPGEAAVLAVQAGADLLLMPEDPQSARQAILDAVSAGRLSEARINESVLRIITLKLNDL